MNEITAEQVRGFLLDHFSDRLSAAGYVPQEVPDDFDLLAKGIIDSFGVMELVVALEEKFGVEVDFENLAPEDLTVIGPFATYVAEYMKRGRRDGQAQ